MNYHDITDQYEPGSKLNNQILNKLNKLKLREVISLRGEFGKYLLKYGEGPMPLSHLLTKIVKLYHATAY